jgi:hypothetical protein
MPLNKTPGAAVATAAPVAAVPAAAPAVAAEKPAAKKRSLQPKAAVAAAPAVEQAVDAAGQAAAALQPRDMEPKEKRIQRSGIWQAVVQSNALVQYAPTLDAFLDLVDKAADRGLQYVNRQ